jgi:predicted nucleic-acid-binding protein
VSTALDTNVLVRVLVQDPTAAAQCAAARRVVAEATASGEPLLVTLCALLETEWVLRSRYKVDRAAMTATVIAMLETPGIEFEHAPTVEEALYLFGQYPSADFADCLLAARATQLGRNRFLSFDAGAARLPRGELVRA